MKRKIIYKIVSFILLSVFMILSMISCGSKNDKKDYISEQSDGTEIEQIDWVAQLKIAEDANQILVVLANGDEAVVSLHNKSNNGVWEEVLVTEANIGKNGIGKTKEGDEKTPRGIYRFTFAFGIKEDPGTVYEYTQVDNSYYWVDDTKSKYYNQFVTTDKVEMDWESAEHIVSAEKSYYYVLATNYNEDCIPGVGSAIFMHCKPTGGAGCIAVSEESMIAILQNIQTDCVLLIDEEANMFNY